MKLIVLFCIFIGAHLATAGNGSSGVGNSPVAVTTYMESWAPTFNVEKRGNHLVDTSNNEKILEVLPISNSEYNKLVRKYKFVDTALGGMKGLEFSPNLSEKKKNYWLICDDNQDDCVKLSVKASKNVNIRPIIGNLKKKR